MCGRTIAQCYGCFIIAIITTVLMHAAFRPVVKVRSLNAVEDSSNVLFHIVCEAALIAPFFLKLTHTSKEHFCPTGL